MLQFDATNVYYLKLGSTANEVEGQSVLVIGNPEGLEGTVSTGIISAFRENRSFIQITAPISPGSSGSPVIDADSGEVIGIATWAHKEGQNLNLALAAEKVWDIFPTASQTPPPEATPTQRQPSSPSTAESTDVFQIAFIAWKAGNYEMAISGFDETIQRWPRSARAWALRGDAQRHLKHYGNAIRDYTEAIRLSPGSDFSYEGRSKVFETLGDHVKAAQDLRKARELRKNK
jgi:tetratricopeptide (TPR) repeat protein